MLWAELRWRLCNACSSYHPPKTLSGSDLRGGATLIYLNGRGRGLCVGLAFEGSRTSVDADQCGAGPENDLGHRRLCADTSDLPTPLADDEAQEVLRRATTPANGTLQA